MGSRVRAVLTLGLSIPSRWNPVYRWWARRRTQRDVAVALKALLVRHYPDGKVVLTGREMSAAQDWAGWGQGQPDGSYKLVVLRDERPRVKRPSPVWGGPDGRAVQERLDG